MASLVNNINIALNKKYHYKVHSKSLTKTIQTYHKLTRSGTSNLPQAAYYGTHMPKFLIVL
jgi:hypothetical protein